jgi:hypothetical protein
MGIGKVNPETKVQLHSYLKEIYTKKVPAAMRCMQLQYDRSRSKAPPSAVREMPDMRTD